MEFFAGRRKTARQRELEDGLREVQELIETFNRHGLTYVRDK